MREGLLPEEDYYFGSIGVHAEMEEISEAFLLAAGAETHEFLG